MEYDADRILTTHVGSLRRPPELADLLKRRRAGEAIDEARFDRLVEEATRDAIRRQAEVGIDLANDGEQAKTGFQFYVYDRLGGLGGEGAGETWADLKEYPQYAKERYRGDRAQPAATGPITYEGRSTASAERDQFYRLLDEVDASFGGTFLTAATPGQAATAISNDYYETYEEFVFALADSLAEEYSILTETDAVIQLDSPDLLAHAHRQFQDRSHEEFADIVRLHVDALNEAVAGIPAERLRLHTCWGNYPGPHHLDIPLETVLPLLYEADVSELSIEQANPRHQLEYRAFDEHPLPDEWVLFPGVIDVKTNVIEPPAVVADRLERFAEVVGDPSRVIATPDCGFGTVAGGTTTVADDVVWAKLESMVEGARLASERLF